MFFFPQTANLERILTDPKLDGAIVSVTVNDLSGKPIFEHNSSIHVVPASNQKLLSASFALWELGPGYRPRTSFWKLQDRIVIDAPGDPLMRYSQLLDASKKLGSNGRLPVYVRESYAPEIPDSWEIDDLPNRYSAAVSSLTFDQGGFQAWSLHGKPTLVPAPFGVSVDYRGGSGKPIVEYDPILRKLVVRGAMPSKDQMLDTLAIPRPDEAAASIFGNSFYRTDLIPATPPDTVIIGGSTQEMIAACLPPSDNNIAENLFLLGATKLGDLGSSPYLVARKRESEFLNHVVGIQPQDVHPYDGSGLSRHNYLTTRAIAKLLCWADSQPTSSIWHNALATPGKGTLSHRLQGLTFEGKTGSLDMVSSLSGYLTTRSGKKLVVSIVMNQFGCSGSEAHSLQDQIISELAAD